jgi:hypothetical protein
MEYLKLLLIVIGILGLAMFGLAIQIIFKKTHKFPNMHVSGNKKLADQGVTCAQSWDKMEQRKAKEEMKYKNLTLTKD